MKINLVLYHYFNDRMSRLIYEAESLVRNKVVDKCIISVICDTGEGEFEVYKPGIEIQRFKLLTNKLPLGMLKKILMIFEFQIRVFFRYIDVNIYSIHANSIEVLPVSIILKFFKKTPVIYTACELESKKRNQLLNFFNGVVEYFFIKFVDYTVVVSDAIKDWYVKKYNLDKIEVVYNVHPTRLNRVNKYSRTYLRDKFNIQKNKIVFIFVGSFSQRRFIKELLDVFSTVTDKADVIFIGYETSDRLGEKILEYSGRYNNIHIHPPVPHDEVIDILAGADVGISIIEPISLHEVSTIACKFFEYLQAGIPVLANPLKGVVSILDKYDCGWQVESDEVSIKSFIRTISFKEIISRKNSIKELRSVFNWESEEKKLLDIYKSIKLDDKSKILFIFHDQSKYSTVGGNVRVKKLIKYFKRFGLKTSLTTFKSDNPLSVGYEAFSKNLDNVYYFTSRLPSKPYNLKYYEFCFYLLFNIKRIVLTDKPGTIIFSVPPTNHLVSILLLRLFYRGVIVLDMRDAWGFAPFISYENIFGKIVAFLDKYLEKHVLSCIDLLVVMTKTTYERYLNGYKFLKNKIVLIPNGYDEEDLGLSLPNYTKDNTKVFNICYSGVLRLDSTWLIDAIKIIKEKHNDKINFTFVGSDTVPNYKELSAMVTYIPPVNIASALKIVKDSNVALLIQDSIKSKLDAVAGKTYEYIALGKPIIAVLPEGDNADIVKEYSKDSRMIHYSQTKHLVEDFVKIVEAYYVSWENGDLKDYECGEGFVKTYSREHIARQYIEKINKVLKTKNATSNN